MTDKPTPAPAEALVRLARELSKDLEFADSGSELELDIILATFKKVASPSPPESTWPIYQTEVAKQLAAAPLREAAPSASGLEAHLKWALNHVVQDEEMGAEEIVKWRENYAAARAALRQAQGESK